MMFRYTLLSSLLVGLSIPCGTLLATPISVPNFSFEDTDVAAGSISGSTPGWLRVGGGGTYELVGVDFLSIAPLPAPADGNQMAYFESGTANPGTVILTSAASLGTVSLGMTYTLTAAVGHRNFDAAGGRRPDDYMVELLVDGSPVASNTLLNAHTNIPSGEWANLSTSYSAPAAGGELTIRLTHSSDDLTFRQGAFDNIRLDVVPEPTTFALTALGMLALSLRRGKTA